MTRYFTKEIKITRPLYFLCGPNIKRDSRRKVVANYIKKSASVNTPDISPYCIIVDQIFNNDKVIKGNSLKLNLLEEIVSCISYKTYIFLDSISTSYELGLFHNSNTKNQLTIFYGEERKKERILNLGEYVQKSFYPNPVIKYDAKIIQKIKSKSARTSSKKNHSYEKVSFLRKKDIPISLKTAIDGDICSYAKNPYLLDFSNNSILFECKEKILKVFLTTKQLFYILSGYSLRYTSKDFSELICKKFNDFYTDFFKYTSSLFLNNMSKGSHLFICHDLKISIEEYSDNNSREVIRHMAFLIVLIYQVKSKAKYLINKNEIVKANTSSAMSIEKMPIFSKSTLSTAIDYSKSPKKYVEIFYLSVRGKKRRMVRYKNNEFGKRLKIVHQNILNFLNNALPSSGDSFAYKEKISIKDCVNKHINSNVFYKIDIKKYFGSIGFYKCISKIINQLQDNLTKNQIFGDFDNELKETKSILKCCFYDYRLPLGFITSPKISDFYLNDFDRQIVMAFKKDNYKYTRYADDILVSHTSSLNSVECEKLISRLLTKNGLKINNRKKLFRTLKNEGDSFKFLGLLIVKRNDKNIIKISNNFWKQIIEEIKKCEKMADMESTSCYLRVCGKINYLKFMDSFTFDKFLKSCTSKKINVTPFLI